MSVLRATAAALRISGSGFGSVARQLADLSGLVEAIAAGELTVTPRTVSLSEVTEAWAHEDVRGSAPSSSCDAGPRPARTR